MRLPLKFVVPFGGLAFKSFGGMESLGPPVGAPICAQLLPMIETV